MEASNAWGDTPHDWQWENDDAPRHDEEDRYAIYAVKVGRRTDQRRLCETSLEGVGPSVLQMLREEEVPRGWRIGVLDRLLRLWLINPFA